MVVAQASARFNAIPFYMQGGTPAPPPTVPTIPNTGLYFAGTNGINANSAATPSAADLNISGDLEIVVRVKLVDYTAASYQTLYSKGSDNGDPWLAFTSAGMLRFDCWDSAIPAQRQYLTTNPSPFVDGTTYWIKATLDITNGTNSVVTFYYAEDQDTEPSSWTTYQAITNVIITSVRASSVPVEWAGTYAGSSYSAKGTFYKGILRNGIGGTTVTEADFSQPWVGNRYTDSTGKVWTINGSTWAWEMA